MNSRVLTAALAAMMACACTTEVVLEPKDTSVKVIMNAQLKTGQDESIIYLSASTVADTEGLRDATVTVSVNGGAPVQAAEQPVSNDYRYDKGIPYNYSGSFKPGDNVVVEASTKYGKVKSTIIVPEKVNMESVDTLRTIIKGSGYTEVNMQFKIKISDKPGVRNFYRLTFYMEECYDQQDGEGKRSVSLIIPADGSTDPVLSEGTLNTGDLLSELLEITNSYLIFNDNTFNGETRTLRVNVSMENLIAGYSYMHPLPEDPDPGYVHVVLEHLSFEEYYYLKAMTTLANRGYDATMFFEPTTIPSNVEGGLGFVSVTTKSDPVTFRIPDDIYLYEVRYREEHPDEDPYY